MGRMLGRRGGVRRRAVSVAAATFVAAAMPLSGALAQTSSPTSSTSVPLTAPSTSTTAPPATTTTLPPATTTTEPPPEPPVVTTPPSTEAATTSAPPATEAPAPPGPPPPSLSEAAVDSFLDGMVRTPASSTSALVDALRALQDSGLSDRDAAMLGMGRFPIGGEAFYRDDFGDYRAGPPVHSHQGTDIFAAFDVPVRSPADGVIRFEEGGLGGNAVFVTEPDGTYYYLAHLNGFAPGLASGSQVKVGQLIGFNGDSGNARGGPPHVHFEIHPGGGAAVNPKPILDKWMGDALANVPALIAPYLGGGSTSRSLTAVGIVRHFDGGLLSGPARDAEESAKVAQEIEAQVVADAIVTPLTPAVLRENEIRRTG